MPYNINNSNILQYYPLNTDFYDYSSGSPVNNSTVVGSFALTNTTSIDGSGSAYSPGWGGGGTNKSYLTMTSQSPTLSNGLTVSIWIKYKNLPTNELYSRFFNWRDMRTGATSNWNISLNVRNSTVHITINGNSSIGQQTISTGYVINDTNWHHYCFTYESTGSVKVYVDNVQKLTFTHLHTGQPLYVCELARNYFGESGLNGYFDQYVAFNRTLTTTEISYLYLYPSTLTISSASSGFISPYTIGTAPTITSITNGPSSFSVFFTAGTGGSPAPTTYQYSLNGGSTYTNANTTTSPIVISSGISPGITYQIALIATNAAGNTAASNIVAAIIQTIGTPPTITSITNNATTFTVNFTSGTGGYPAPSTYYYSINGGSTYTNANTTTSPIVINNGIASGITYQIALIATNAAGNTAASNIVAATIPYPCFLEGSKILRLNLKTDQEEYVAVETLREGDLIKTSRNGYKAIFHIGRKTLPNPANDPDKRNRLYRFPKSVSKNMIADLCITGEHCVLYKDLSPTLKERVYEHMGDIYITEYQYRVPACLDERAIPYTGTKTATIWHFALECDNIYYNYGVYANGLLVESCSIQYLTELSEMELV